MRVLFVTNMWPDVERPWYGTFIHTQAQSLKALGVEVDVMPIRGYAGRAAYLRAAARLSRPAAARAHDVVHAHYGHSGVVARLQLRRPLVVSYCGDDLLGTRTQANGITTRSRVEAAVFRQLARVAAATITKSAEMEATLPRSARARNRVIPNGVDLEAFSPGDRGGARAQLGWDAEQPSVLFVGDPRVAAKNLPLAEAACARLTATVPGAQLRVAWGHPPEAMPTLMRAADALVFTSRSEGSPNAIKEALATELPVVSTPVGDVPERLRGLPGCSIRPPDPDALAEGLAAAIRHGRVPEARRAVADLSLDRVARRVLSVYEAVLSSRTRQRRG